jgi:hypothetical protein
MAPLSVHRGGELSRETETNCVCELRRRLSLQAGFAFLWLPPERHAQLIDGRAQVAIERLETAVCNEYNSASSRMAKDSAIGNAGSSKSIEFAEKRSAEALDCICYWNE